MEFLIEMFAGLSDGGKIALAYIVPLSTLLAVIWWQIYREK